MLTQLLSQLTELVNRTWVLDEIDPKITGCIFVYKFTSVGLCVISAF